MEFITVLRIFGIFIPLAMSVGSISLLKLFIEEKQYKNFDNSCKMYLWLSFNIILWIVVIKVLF